MKTALVFLFLIVAQFVTLACELIVAAMAGLAVFLVLGAVKIINTLAEFRTHKCVVWIVHRA